MARQHILLIVIIAFSVISFLYFNIMGPKNERAYKTNLSYNKYRKMMDLLQILVDPHLDLREYLTVYRQNEFKEVNESVELWEWETVKKRFNRTYTTNFRENEAKTVLLENLKYIREHNRRYDAGEFSYNLGLNRLFDYEMTNYTSYTILGSNIQFKISDDDGDDDDNNFSSGDSPELPISIDWRKNISAPPIRYQGNCGSCWAFASNAAIEFHYLIYKHTRVSLSVQQLIDCARNYGCARGGWPIDAFRYIVQNDGINLENDYPYQDSETGSCAYYPSKSRITIEDYGFIHQGDEQHLEEIVALKGPVVVGIDARGDFLFYKSGIFYAPLCSTDLLDHAVVVIGYGTENGQDYWIIRNSWGEEWGEDGYGKIAKNLNNSCGIATNAVYPII